MKDLSELRQYRVKGTDDDDGGAFVIPYGRKRLLVVASHGMGWDHVSVSLNTRTPRWDEMEHVKRLFFRDDEWAMQLHAPPSKHISIHPNCLHIWRPHDFQMPLPDPMMV